MPMKPNKPCKHPQCSNLTGKTYCYEHGKLYEKHRGSASERGYDSKWQSIRKKYLLENPLCVECMNQCKTTEATEVHHIIALRDGGTHDYNNLMALCKSCHSKITVRQLIEYKY